MNDVKKGDVLTRIYEDWSSRAEVIEVTQEAIVCLVFVDIPRRMVFDRKTGISLLGQEYGRIIEQVETVP